MGGKRATIRRSVKAANVPTITPDDPDVKAAFAWVSSHPEFVLSRRELIRYVLAEAGQRAKEVQALLRLEDIEKLRAILQKISNACAKELSQLTRAESVAETQLRDALMLPQLTASGLLSAVNWLRGVIGLAPLVAIDVTTSLKMGLEVTAETPAPARVPKTQATADLATMTAALDTLRSSAFQTACVTAATKATELGADAASVEVVSREALLRAALGLYDGKVCPVCDTEFEPDTFCMHVEGKLKHFAAVTAQRKALEARIAPLLDQIHAVGAALTTVIDHAEKLNPQVVATPLVELRSVLRESYRQLRELLPLDETVSVLNALREIPDLACVTGELAQAIARLPDPTKQDGARDALVLAQERLEKYRTAKREAALGRVHADRATTALRVFGEVTTKALERIYTDVERAFTVYYRKINENDESAFTAKLTPSMGKLSFDVDFYGRGHFPPGAYHSEGHQDGMGLCLYLALMSHLQSSNFTFAVLDDVLMSVDAGHRREVCKLLREQFPNTQFIFTTHDDIWLKHMKSEGLVKGRNFAHFRTWSVDLGPVEWDDHDVWTEVRAHVAKNDVRAAAALLRHYLEHFSKEACDRLRADVEFRGNALFTLGDLLPRATAAMSSLFKKAKAAANLWNKKDLVAEIAAREAMFAGLVSKANVDNWQVNAAVHFNSWADLQRQDFEPVVAAYKELTAAFSCNACQAMFYVSPEREEKESLRCACGDLNLNLVPKRA
jgi:hypothetical protein